MWLLYSEPEDLKHQIFFFLKLHQYRFLYQITAVHIVGKKKKHTKYYFNQIKIPSSDQVDL